VDIEDIPQELVSIVVLLRLTLEVEVKLEAQVEHTFGGN